MAVSSAEAAIDQIVAACVVKGIASGFAVTCADALRNRARVVLRRVRMGDSARRVILMRWRSRALVVLKRLRLGGAASRIIDCAGITKGPQDLRRVRLVPSRRRCRRRRSGGGR